MLIFNLKKEWFEKIKSGEKTHEYREVKPYWTKRLEPIEHRLIIKPNSSTPEYWTDYCYFVCGYASKDDKDKRLKARIKSISIINGKNTDLKVDKDVYDIEFELKAWR